MKPEFLEIKHTWRSHWELDKQEKDSTVLQIKRTNLKAKLNSIVYKILKKFCEVYDTDSLVSASSSYLYLLVSLCEHGTVYIIDHHIDLLANRKNSMKILPIYCYNDDDNDLMTMKKQQTQIFILTTGHTTESKISTDCISHLGRF